MRPMVKEDACLCCASTITSNEHITNGHVVQVVTRSKFAYTKRNFISIQIMSEGNEQRGMKRATKAYPALKDRLQFARALQARPFALLWPGQTISVLGDAVFTI